MPRHDLANRFLSDLIIQPDVHTSAPSPVGFARLNDAESVMLAHFLGVYNDGTFDFTVEEAADDGTGSPDTWAAAAAEDVVIGSQDQSAENIDAQPVYSFDGGSKADDVVLVTYRGPEPFVRVTVAASNVTNGAGFGVGALRGDLRRQT